MGNEDAGDQELQSPPRNQGQSDEKSHHISRQSVGQNVDNCPNGIEQPSPMTSGDPNTTDDGIAATRMSVTTVIDETAHITKPLHGVHTQETELNDSDKTSVPKTVFRRTTSNSAAMLRVLLSQRHRQQSEPC